jgi:hypothetical protein
MSLNQWGLGPLMYPVPSIVPIEMLKYIICDLEIQTLYITFTLRKACFKFYEKERDK